MIDRDRDFRSMTETSAKATLVERVAAATPPSLAAKFRGLSDRAIAWLFIAPTILLLLAINIFPLIWTIWLSFTNYHANRPNAPILGVGTQHYSRHPHRSRHLASRCRRRRISSSGRSCSRR